MTAEQFPALMLEEREGRVSATVQQVSADRLPEGDVTVRVTHSALNYKDGMIVAGQGRLVRAYPHIPGVDFAGIVETSASPAFRPGDPVILTGWRVGETRWGGYAGLARVKAEWLVRPPAGLGPAQAMAIGTAGLTAMLAVIALEKHGMKPDAGGEVLVTGAAGGVGSIAIALLARLGYRVCASTGRATEHDYLRRLGASAIIDRAELATPSAKPLLAERWIGCIDAVGGTALATSIAGLRYRASVAACGLAGGNALSGTVLPFLLRGVNLLGIDSVMCPMPEREAAWARLARDLPADALATIAGHARLADLPELATRILAGQVRGRIVIDVAEG